MRRRLPLRFSALMMSLCAASATALAPQTAGDPSGAPHAGQDAPGLQEIDGTLWGFGANYKVRFADDGIEFTPALGERAPHNLPWSFHTLSIGRAGEQVARRVEATAPIASTADAPRVTYAREGVHEVYALRPGGVKQSYLLAERPAGTGDLVVRGRVTTELPLIEAGDDGLVFALDGVGGVRVGAVVGIDASGRRASGSMRYSDGVLEFTLPESFVDAAAYPLELDPLIGSVQLYGTGGDDRIPDASYSAGSLYLVVWSRRYSASNSDIMARVTLSNGAPFGGIRGIRVSTSRFSELPSVAYVLSHGAFVVAWSESADVYAASVSTSTLVVSRAAIIAGGPNLQISPDVGGEVTAVDDEVVVVWRDLTAGQLLGAQIIIDSLGNLSGSISRPVITNDAAAAGPEIAKSGGTTGRYLVVWERTFSGLTRVYGAIIDRNARVLAAPFVIFQGRDYDAPAVDGDGQRWFVTCEGESSPGAGNDLYGRLVEFGPGGVEMDPPWRIVQSSSDERRSAVAWLGASVLIGYTLPRASSDDDAFVVAIDPLACRSCGSSTILEVGSRDDDFVAITSKRSGDLRVDDDALVVWQSRWATSGLSEVHGRRFLAANGTVTDLGGHCDRGGIAHSPCARVGNANFTMSLRDAAPGVAAFSVLSFERRDLRCGACRFVADPFLGFVIPSGTTNGGGHAALTLGIPNSAPLRGLTLIQQWATSPGLCSTFNVALSNALEIVIE